MLTLTYKIFKLFHHRCTNLIDIGNILILMEIWSYGIENIKLSVVVIGIELVVVGELMGDCTPYFFADWIA